MKILGSALTLMAALFLTTGCGGDEAEPETPTTDTPAVDTPDAPAVPDAPDTPTE